MNKWHLIWFLIIRVHVLICKINVSSFEYGNLEGGLVLRRKSRSDRYVLLVVSATLTVTHGGGDENVFFSCGGWESGMMVRENKVGERVWDKGKR